jgi:DNA replication protein DnaC
LLAQNGENRSFEIDEFNSDQIDQIIYYLTNDVRFDKDQNKALMLMGSVGTGKSMLMEISRRSYAYLSMKMFQIIPAMKIARAYADNNVNLINIANNTGLLCIDDMGCEPKTVKHYGTEYAPIVDVLHFRYTNRRPTFITTNLNPDELEDHYDIRIRNRIKQMCNAITFKGPSRRK